MEEPAGYREGHDAFQKGLVERLQDVFADSKRIPEEVKSLLTPPEDLLCVGRVFQPVFKGDVQVFILLSCLHWLPMDDGGVFSSQISLSVGEGHHHLFGSVS